MEGETAKQNPLAKEVEDLEFPNTQGINKENIPPKMPSQPSQEEETLPNFVFVAPKRETRKGEAKRSKPNKPSL